MRLARVEEVDRVFGHLELEVLKDDGEVKAFFKVTHGARFIELTVNGRPYWEVPYVASRICGACSIAHYVASIRAVEHALGLDAGEWVEDFRDAVNMVQIAQNHLVHLAFLALPDYVGVQGLSDLKSRAGRLVVNSMKLNAACLKVIKLIAGRIVNPNTLGVGGLLKRPFKGPLLKAADYLRECEALAKEVVDEALTLLKVPELKDPANNCVAVKPRKTYLTTGDEILTSAGLSFKPSNYGEHLEEVQPEYSNSKAVILGGAPVHVGARARYELLRNYLHDLNMPEVDLGNPFSNLIIKAAEIPYCITAAREILEDLARRTADAVVDPPRDGGEGEGVGVVEAPRGLLIHHYVVSGKRVVNANIITPTEINARHIEASAKALTESLVSDGRPLNAGELQRKLTMLVRAYDPCLPCAVHVSVVRGRKHA